MIVMLELQISLKLLTKNMLFSSSKRNTKVLNTGKWIEVGKVVYSNRFYIKIEKTDGSTEQKKLAYDFIQKIEITALKAKNNINGFMITANFIF